jgi:hypothetical protein
MVAIREASKHDWDTVWESILMYGWIGRRSIDASNFHPGLLDIRAFRALVGSCRPITSPTLTTTRRWRSDLSGFELIGPPSERCPNRGWPPKRVKFRDCSKEVGLYRGLSSWTVGPRFRAGLLFEQLRDDRVELVTTFG